MIGFHVENKIMRFIPYVLGVALFCTVSRADDGGVGLDEAQENDEYRAELDALKQEVEELKSRLDAADEGDLADIEQARGVLDIYGFFDVSLFKMFLTDDNVMKGIQNDNLSFIVPGVNIYISSQMTETLSALVELRFTFLPSGQDASYVPYERVDTTVGDSYQMNRVRLGGVMIERVHMTWQPWDFFGITAGRFLTPFGIWNIDHGSPVLITVVPPYIMIRQIIPVAQTGVQIHGRFYPSSRTFFDYALTMSNGRGPMDEVFDLDDDKALGLRLRLEYEGDHSSVAFGGYGYWGHYTDITKEILPGAEIGEIDFVEERTERFEELGGSLDFVLQIHGVRLQSEYARSLRKYEVRPFRDAPILDSPMGDLYQPDFIQWNVYVLLAWELPLKALLGDMKLTPFGMFEYSVEDDSAPEFDAYMFRFGLNFKPNPHIVLKAVAGYAKAVDSHFLPSGWWNLAGQAAVTF